MKTIILGAVLTLLTLSCSSSKINSLAMVGRDYTEIKNSFMGMAIVSNKDEFTCYEGSDSLLVLSYLNNMPFESLFLFQNDTCTYQKLRIYCSPCADEIVHQIIEDRNFKFKPIDSVNYISKASSNTVMRLKEKIDKEGNCNEISIHKINNH